MCVHTALPLVSDPVDRLLSQDQDVTPKQEQVVREKLSGFDSKTLAFIAHNDARLHITETPGEVLDLIRASGFPAKQLTVTEAAVRATELRQTGDELLGDPAFQASHRAVAESQAELGLYQRSHPNPFGLGMAAGHVPIESSCEAAPANPTPLDAQPFPKPDPELVRLNNQLYEARNNRLDIIKATFGSDFPEHQRVTLETLIFMSGAETPAERKEARELIVAANGDRINQAQKAALTQQREALQTQTGPALGHFQKALAAAEADPDMIAFDMHQFAVVPAPVRYVELPSGDRVRMPADTDIEKWIDGSNGLHFRANGLMQVDHEALGLGTVPHEVGHSIMHHLQRSAPEFYQDWSSRLAESYEAAQKAHRCGQPVNSHYGLTNLDEYLAEGARHYMRDPETLKEVDGSLHGLVEEALDKASEMPGHHPWLILFFLANAGLATWSSRSLLG